MKTQILSLFLILTVILQSNAQTAEPGTELKKSPFQFSIFIPPLGTNGMYFYNTINDFSFNTFIGAGAATNFCELNGFMGFDRYYADGLQASGFASVVGFGADAQEYSSEGVQLSGFLNANGNSYTGVQMAGFANVNNRFQGLQLSGFLNANRNAEKAMMYAGFLNVNNVVDKTVELAGFANISFKGTSIAQLSGFGNVAQDVKGVQGSGFFNVARDIQGVQGAGFINVARKVRGVQASGFINICDSIDGIPVGVISIVLINGYRNFEVSTSEWSPVQLTYRMGVEKFYNIYTLSKLDGTWDRYALGFGFGHNRQIFKKTDLNIELVNHREIVVQPDVFRIFHERENNLSQLKIGIRRNLFSNIWLNVGPTLNMSWAYQLNGFALQGEDLQPYLWKVEPKTSTNYPHWNSRFWLGFHAGISIF